MSKPVILTGLRATNDLHIGNYFGAVLPIVDMAKNKSKDYQINLFMPDLHSITTPVDYSKLNQQIMSTLRQFVACGLDITHPDVYMYRQSYIPAHSELAIILNCFTGMGEMNRMTQFKDKSGKLSAERISVGLFGYPVLMAADILLYDALYVPVGDDQSQHLEFTRDIATRLNNQFGDLFTVPKPVKDQHLFFGKDQGLRIKDLVDPAKKMSKSDDTGKGVIFLSDSPEIATKKIMAATTDSFGEVKYDPQNRPGISNLLQILALTSNRNLDDVIKEYDGKTQYGQLKQVVADNITNFLSELSAEYDAVDMRQVTEKLTSSEAAMSKVASAKLKVVQKSVGLRS